MLYGVKEYRPICLSDTMGKMMGRAICNRLLPIVESSNVLSIRESGCRRSYFTEDAINIVVNLTKYALISSGSDFVLLFDLENAFNSVNYKQIKGALPYLSSVIGWFTVVSSRLKRMNFTAPAKSTP